MYLEQQVQFSVSPLSGHLHSLLGSVQFQAELLEEPAEMGDVPSPYVGGQAPVPKDAWYADASYHGTGSEMMGVIIDVDTNTSCRVTMPLVY